MNLEPEIEYRRLRSKVSIDLKSFIESEVNLFSLEAIDYDGRYFQEISKIHSTLANSVTETGFISEFLRKLSADYDDFILTSQFYTESGFLNENDISSILQHPTRLEVIPAAIIRKIYDSLMIAKSLTIEDRDVLNILVKAFNKFSLPSINKHPLVPQSDDEYYSVAITRLVLVEIFICIIAHKFCSIYPNSTTLLSVKDKPTKLLPLIAHRPVRGRPKKQEECNDLLKDLIIHHRYEPEFIDKRKKFRSTVFRNALIKSTAPDHIKARGDLSLSTLYKRIEAIVDEIDSPNLN